MGSDRHHEVKALAHDVGDLLLRLDPRSLRMKPNSYEPTVAESLALGMLELDRIASEARIGPGPLPAFASDFLNRRLSRRLLQRYQGRELPAEFERRLHDALERLASGRMVDREGPLERIRNLLAELESALLQRQGSGDRDPER